jgi:hypothetical protein
MARASTICLYMVTSCSSARPADRNCVCLTVSLT